MRHDSKPVKIFIAIILVFLGITFLYPLLWLVMTSLKGPREVYSNPIGLPEEWLFSNYVSAFKKFDFLQYFMNSVIYTVCTVALVLCLVTLFTYATARLSFKSAGKLQRFIQIGMVIPGGATLLGIYQLLLETGLKNTYPGMILVYTAMNLPLACVVMYGFFRTLPIAMEEAAALDGAGTFTTFFRVMLPLAKPGASTVAIITAIHVWNEYTVAAITVDKAALKSLPVGISTFMTSRGGDWGGMAAALTLGCLPIIILYLFFNKSLENAISTSAAIK